MTYTTTISVHRYDPVKSESMQCWNDYTNNDNGMIFDDWLPNHYPGIISMHLSSAAGATLTFTVEFVSEEYYHWFLLQQ
jgi:hypothetical protein